MTLRIRGTLAISVIALAAGLHGTTAVAGPDPYLGEIFCGGWSFAPRGTISLEGQLLAISQYSALFSLLGTQYGGDGRTTFGVPDLRGRTMIGQGRGPGLSQRREGERGGTETNVMTASQMPSHAHPHAHEMAPLGASSDATSNDPQGRVPARKSRTTLYADPVSTPGSSNLVEQAVTETRTGSANAGGGQPMNNMPPFVTIRCVMAIQGVFPSRN